MRADSYCMFRIGSAVLVATAATMTFGTVIGVDVVQAAPPAVSVESSSLVYTVKNGDSLFGIAVKVKVSMNDLLSVNALTVTSPIHPGDRLTLPVGGVLPPEAPASSGASPSPSPSAPAAVAAPVGGPYVVAAGDYLVGIAARNGVTLKALLAANNLTVTSAIFPGNKLVLPPATLPISTPKPAAAVASAAGSPAPAAPEAASPAPSAPGQYVVKNGDFFFSIAKNNGVTLKALLAANNMTVATMLHPGNTLVLPAATLPIPAAPPAAEAATPAASGAPSPQQSQIATVLTFLQGELGKPYLFNTSGPATYDCSGLVVAAFKKVGVNLPHQSLLQSTKGAPVDWRAVDIQAGDLIFQIGTGKTYISHVGIAISSTQWIQAARAGDVVKISSIPIDDKIAAVRRVVH